MLGGPAFGVGEEGPDLGKRTLVNAPTAERHREQRVEIANGGEREPGFLQRLPCRRACAREQHADAIDFCPVDAQRLREGEDTAGGGDQVLDQMDALTGDSATLVRPAVPCALASART